MEKTSLSVYNRETKRETPHYGAFCKEGRPVTMKIELTGKEFRRLLDMVYIGHWILNSSRGSDRIADYDQVESRLFGRCRGT